LSILACQNGCSWLTRECWRHCFITPKPSMKLPRSFCFLGLILSAQLKAVFSSAFPKFLGRISFTLYLIHIPMICSVMTWVILYIPAGTPYLVHAIIAAGITATVTLSLAALVNGFVDVRMTAFSRDAGRWLDRQLERWAKQSRTAEFNDILKPQISDVKA